MSKKQALLDAAEKRVRTGGYDNFSFRDLANDVGIKSASVHYHFPTKASLAETLVHNYTEKFMSALPDLTPDTKGACDPIDAYIQLFRSALVEDELMCLCGLFGAETDALPGEVQHQTERFFERNIQWLTLAYEHAFSLEAASAKQSAITLIAGLEGAMLMSKSLNDISVFETVAARLALPQEGKSE